MTPVLQRPGVKLVGQPLAVFVFVGIALAAGALT